MKNIEIKLPVNDAMTAVERAHKKRWTWTLCLLAGLLFSGCGEIQRSVLFYPTHHTDAHGLDQWTESGRLLGYSRMVAQPDNVWLMLHGNAGQAADRAYALHAFAKNDAVFILEYPGYGLRPGEPSKEAFDAAAIEAYRLLRKTFPRTPVCVVGESIGSGPACLLAKETVPPDKLVLMVPFDEMKKVAADHAPFMPTGLIFAGSWNNLAALSGYRGPVDIYGAEYDNVIAVSHAKALAAGVPQALLRIFPGGHNDWSRQGDIIIRNTKP